MLIPIKTVYKGLLCFFLLVGGLFPLTGVAHKNHTDAIKHTSLQQDLGHLFVAEEGTTLDTLTEKLQEKGFVHFGWLYKLRHLLFGDGVTPGGFALSKDMSNFAVIETLKYPDAVWVTLPKNGTRADVTVALGDALDWNEREKNAFRLAYTSIQWDHLNSILIDSFAEILNWEDVEQKAFMTMATRYSSPEYDFLGTLYVPGEYLIPRSESHAQIAARLVEAYEILYAPYDPVFLAQAIDGSVVSNVHTLVRGEVEDLPDLVPLPAQDINIEAGHSGQTLLVFTTTYWNNGEGPLELVVNLPSTPLTEDITRDVFQRIYRSDGSYIDTLAGTFLWHAEHLHYHFDDFIDYILTPIDVDGPMPEIEPITKATFCVRDVEPIAENIPLGIQGKYSVCGFGRQGISVGWGDSYFFTYPDQSINVTDLPNGTYKLTFNANPEGILRESDMGNNKSSVTIKLDITNKTVEVI